MQPSGQIGQDLLLVLNHLFYGNSKEQVAILSQIELMEGECFLLTLLRDVQEQHSDTNELLLSFHLNEIVSASICERKQSCMACLPYLLVGQIRTAALLHHLHSYLLFVWGGGGGSSRERGTVVFPLQPVVLLSFVFKGCFTVQVCMY